MIPLVQVEVVDAHHWLTSEEFVDTLAMGNALPGPIATKMSAYIGYKLAGLPGAVVGVTGMILPSIILMLALAGILLTYKDTHYVQASLKAVRPWSSHCWQSPYGRSSPARSRVGTPP